MTKENRNLILKKEPMLHALSGKNLQKSTKSRDFVQRYHELKSYFNLYGTGCLSYDKTGKMGQR